MLAAAVKQEVASSRSRAVGVSGGKKIRPSKSSRQQSASATDQRVPVQIEETMEARQVYMPPAVITYDTTHNDEDLLRRAAERDEAIAKYKAKVSNHVEKRLKQERTRRLCEGLGVMNKSDLRGVKAALRAEAREKFTHPDDLEDLQEQDAEPYLEPISSEPVEYQYSGSSGFDFNSSSAPVPDTSLTPSLSAKSTPVHKPFQLKKKANQRPTATSQARGADLQKSARDEARRFLESRNGHQPEHQSHGASAENGNAASEDQWWQQEESKWKDELDSRRQEGYERQQEVANGHGQQYPTEPPHNSDDDICLRSQVVSKSPHDRGLGIQLFTPSNGQGVRITKIDPMGPFGRTQAFEDGDVIVEIDGVPLLYGGHAAVLGAIQSAMSSPARQMNVTVCSPAELSKLEALVDDASDDSSTAGKTSASAAETTTPPRRTTGGWGKILVESTKKLTKSMSVFALGGKKPATPTDGTTGTLRGAPAWWKDSAKKKPAADNTTPAKNGPTGTGGGDGAVARELQYGGEQTFASQHDAIVIDEPAYLIYRADIHDLEAYKQDYMSRTTEIIAKFGGRWLARGGKVTTLEGSSDSNEHNTVLQRMVLIEFPSMQAAKDFFHSEEYQDARQSRLSIATAELTVLEGMVPSMRPQ